MEAYKVVAIPCHVFLSQLHHCISTFACVGIAEAYRAHRAVAHSVTAPFCHNLNGHTAVKQFLLFKVVKVDCFCGDEGTVKGFVFLFLHRQIEIIVSALAVSATKIRLCHVHAVKGHDGSDGVVEKQSVLTGQFCKIVRKVRGGQRACGNDCGHTFFKASDFGVLVKSETLILGKLSFNCG